MTKFSGTFQGQTSGPDLSWLIGAGVVAGVAVAAVTVILELLWLIAALTIALLVAVPVAWFLTRGIRARRRAEVAAQWGAAREAAVEADRLRQVERHQRRLEIARASAPVVQNIIDPAGIAAALGVQYQLRQPARVVRGEVER